MSSSMVKMIIQGGKLLAPTFLTNWIDGVSQDQKKWQKSSRSPNRGLSPSDVGSRDSGGGSRNSNNSKKSDHECTPFLSAVHSHESFKSSDSPSKGCKRSPSQQQQSSMEHDSFIPTSVFWQLLYIIFWPITILKT